jgi:UDP:flavonoid glycosyltransferase YjiC (YdhE family)
MTGTETSPGAKRRCWIFGFPIFGHTNPLLLLAAELVKSGYRVSFYSSSLFKDAIERTGANFADYNSPAALRSALPMDCDSLDLDEMYAEVNDIYNEVWPGLCEMPGDAELVIYDNLAIWGKRFAQKHHIPSVCSNTFLLTSPQYWKSFKADKLRRDPERWEEFTACLSGASADAMVVYTPPEMQLADALTADRKVICLGNRFNGQYPPNTAELREGALIYISLGTVFNCNVKVFQDLMGYFNDSAYNVVIPTGNNSKMLEVLKAMGPGRNVRLCHFVDQLQVLREASLFITHGGVNSLYESLYFAVPMIIVPQMEEQHINGRKMSGLKVGHCFERGGFSREGLRSAMNGLERNWSDFKRNALQLREALVKSPNAQEAVRQIGEVWMKKGER